VPDCGGPLVNYRDGRFCEIHLPYEDKCGVQGCEQDALETIPACEHHQALYKQFETRFGRDRSMFANRRQVRRQNAIVTGEAERMEWEPIPEQWDSTIKHYWQARHIKVVEIAVAACGMPISHTKFPFAEGTTDIARFMNDTWPADSPERRPNFLSIDKGCLVMATLDVNDELTGINGWMATTRIKVDPWHYNGHQIDELCVKYCNPVCHRPFHQNHRMQMVMGVVQWVEEQLEQMVKTSRGCSTSRPPSSLMPGWSHSVQQ
jgi:hypothetical protein